MKLSNLLEQKNEFTTVTADDIKAWVAEILSFMEDETVDLDMSIDMLIDNDPKFEALTMKQKAKVIAAIRKAIY